MSRHRREVRPRYGRIVALGSAVLVTLTAVLGGIGLLPRDASQEAAGASSAVTSDDAGQDVGDVVAPGRPSRPAGGLR